MLVSNWDLKQVEKWVEMMVDLKDYKMADDLAQQLGDQMVVESVIQMVLQKVHYLVDWKVEN